jgi:hypothetical protein
MRAIGGEKYIFDILDQMNEISIKGFSFNLKSKDFPIDDRYDKEYGIDYLYYTAPI